MSGVKRLIYNVVPNFIAAFDYRYLLFSRSYCPQTKSSITFRPHLKDQFHFISQTVHVRSETFFRKSAILAFSLLQRLTIVKSLLIGMENHVFQNFQSIYSASFDQKRKYIG